ncbi:MAG: hypothetical protein IJ892_05435 [Prevotella sp.]|nr:hypothetical protein [Prevotella sp.]
MKKQYFVMAVAAIFAWATVCSCGSKDKSSTAQTDDADEEIVEDDEDEDEADEEFNDKADYFYLSADMALLDLYGPVQSAVYSERNQADVNLRFGCDAYLISMTRIVDGKPEVANLLRDARGRITDIEWYSDDPWVTMFDYGQDIMPQPVLYISTNRMGNSVTFEFTRDDYGRISHVERTETVHFGEVEDQPAVSIKMGDTDSYGNWLQCTIDEGDYGKNVIKRSIKYNKDDGSKLQSALDKEQKKVKAFITDMYNNYKYGDEDFLKEHCTERLLNQLREAYEYDGEGYAFWLFRTSSTDGLGDGTRVVDVNTDDGLWYVYDFYDGSMRGKNRVKCVVVDGKVWMDEVERLYDEAAETN